MDTLYNRIQSACERSSITVSAMCLAIGMSKSTMSDLKAGRKKSLSSDTIVRMASFLNISADELLFGEKKELAENSEFISPEKQQLMSLIDTLSDEQCRRLAGIIEEAKKLL